MARAPKGIANRAAFESHARIVASDLRGTGMDVPREPGLITTTLLFAAWANRYSRRRDAIESSYGGPQLGDRDLADRLAARWRARDAAARGMPRCWDAETQEHLRMSYQHLGGMAGRLDAQAPDAPHGYGPSFRALCLEAEAQGAADFGAVVDHVLAWCKAPAPIPVSATALKKVAPRLEQRVRWRETGDDGAPWQAEVEGKTWLIRLGDFPNEPAYRLEIDGTPAGVFHDWPETWLRGAAVDADFPAPAPVIALPEAPERWPQRYADGEHEAVWAEMVALGGLVRDKRVLPHAEAVARETMRRVRHNVVLLIPRLVTLGYAFGRPERKRDESRMMMGGPGGGVFGLGEMFEAVRKVNPARLPPHLQGAFGRMMATLGNMSSGGASPAKRKPSDPMRDPDIFAPATPGDAKVLARLARRGLPLPLSLRFWVEEVGHLDLVGRHPVLCPPGTAVLPDPLAIHVQAEDIAEQLEEQGKDDDPVLLVLAYSAADKAAENIDDTDWDDGLAIEVPNAAADGPLSGAAEHPGLVPYLRLALRWGGFPGWAGREDAPREAIAQLTEGMLAF